MRTPRPTRKPDTRSRVRHRRGFTTPAVAIALLVTMAGLALVLDRLWLDAADLELTTAAEAAALAAASELASDDLLRPGIDPNLALDRSRSAAAWIASQNVVAGMPVALDTSEQGDVRLGRLTLDSQSNNVQFVESANFPTTAVVTAMRTRQNSNPVSLFVAGATGLPYGDVVTRVEASVDNRVYGVRPLADVPVPAFPMAIMLSDPTGIRLDTWQVQIQSRLGQDQYGYDPVERRVYSGADGIPEMVLNSQGSLPGSAASNVVVVDFGLGMTDQILGRQFASGLTADDLTNIGGQLCVSAASPLTFRASTDVRTVDRNSMEALIGEPRICLLYSAVAATANSADLLATCVQMVAIRVLAVTDQNNGSCSITVQPCVLKTKTAMLSVSSPYSTDSVLPVSPYLVQTGVSASPATTNTAPAAVGSAAPNTTTATATQPIAETATTGNAATSTTVITVPGNPYIYKLQLSH